MRTIAIATLLLLPALAQAQASAPAPRLLPYQGRLLRADGTPEKETQRLTFRVYAAPDAPSALWSEAQDVPLTNGFYAVFLGAVSVFPDSLFDGHDRWMGVTVGDGPELTPRQQIASVAYALMATSAFRATTADQATAAATATRATSADRAASADYARTAGSAATADTATSTAWASQAAKAESANHALLADNLSGNGDITAGLINATVGFTTKGDLKVANVVAASAVSVGGDLQLSGKLVGGGPRLIGLAKVVGRSASGSLPEGGGVCTAIGAAVCDAKGSAGCSAGELVPWLTLKLPDGVEPPYNTPMYQIINESVCLEQGALPSAAAAALHR